jgi:hypothetical protein
MEKMILVS